MAPDLPGPSRFVAGSARVAYYPREVKAVADQNRSGVVYALSAYGLWGVLPLYFVALGPASALEILGWRIVLSLGFCLVVLLIQQRTWETLQLLRNGRYALLTAAAGVLVAINWGVFVVATQTGHVIDAALGYFTNPLVTALLGVIVLRERLRPAQWVALFLGALAVVVLVVAYGQFPYIALGLAFSFGLYGLVKKLLGPVGALAGLTLETVWITPIAIGLLVFVELDTGLTIATEGWPHLALLASAGVITSVPLLFFAAATRRLALSTVGFIQYLSPILQATVGIVVLGEPMPLERWWGFGLVLVGLVIFVVDGVVNREAKIR